jgi:arylsulfatase A-like enzyme/Tfp pilus assembly protein PilF
MRFHAIAFAALLALSGCARAPEHPDVVLVTIDTLRADRLGCYGDTTGGTPVLDALARDGVRFERASAASPVTLPSHATILTGRYPAAHGVRNNATFTLAPSETTLAEALRPVGYRTGAFVGSWILSKAFGLGQGFEAYDDRFDGPGAVAPAPGPAARGAKPTERRAEAVTDAALAWARAQPRREPVFLWVHYYDPHVSYQPPSPWLERFPDRYRGEVAYTDHELGRLLEGLRAGGRGGEPLVIVVADHGEAFGEHGEHQHGLFVYEPTIHVPWLLAWRGRVPAGGVVAEEVTIADVAPTILGLLGLRPLPATQGIDLSESVLRGVPAPERSGILVENLLPRLEFGWSELLAVRRGGSKYIRAPREELYDLASDPGESRDLAASQRDAAVASRARLDAILREAEQAGSEGGAGATALDDDALANLQSLGYVGATPQRGTSAAGAPPAAADPKDRLEEFLLTKEATRLVSLGEYAQARLKIEALLARDPGNVWMRQQLATIHLATGDASAAEAIYRGILAGDARHCESLFRLGEIAMVATRDLAAAAARFGEALACNPDDARVLGRLAAIERSQGRPEAARRHLDRAVELQPTDRTLLEQLAEAQAAAGEEGASRATWQRLLDLDPRSTAALVGLATLDLRRRDLGAARERLEQALAIDGEHAVANANLGAILLREGELDGAIRRLEAALSKDDSLAPTWRALAEAYERAGRRADAEAARRRAEGR